MTNRPIVLGEQVTDSITGVTGTAVARYEFLYGCVRIAVERLDKDGKPEEIVFDEQRLTTKPSATSGGPRDTPSARHSTP